MLIRWKSPLSTLQPTSGAGAGDAAVTWEASVEPCVMFSPKLTRGDAVSSLLQAAGVNCILSDTERHRGNSLTLSDVNLSICCCSLKRDLALLGLLEASVQMRRCRAVTRSVQCNAGPAAARCTSRTPLLCYIQSWLTYHGPNDYG